MSKWVEVKDHRGPFPVEGKLVQLETFCTRCKNKQAQWEGPWKLCFNNFIEFSYHYELIMGYSEEPCSLGVIRWRYATKQEPKERKKDAEFQ